MSNQIASVNVNSSALSLPSTASAKVARMSKKDFYATLPAGTGTADKLRKFAAYAALFDTAITEAVKGDDQWQNAGVRVSKSGTRRYITQVIKAEDPVTQAQELAALRKELAALKSEKTANANAITA